MTILFLRPLCDFEFFFQDSTSGDLESVDFCGSYGIKAKKNP